MENLVDLAGQLVIDLGDHGIDEGLVDLLAFTLGLHQFGDERLDAGLGYFVALVARRHLGFGEDLVE